eukprot:TRINITY_DN1904_c1_g1_i1.p1 TRINITY_DN1904_c1_g1~~TRINITY_DN1904_c1_g1_i1.p1  ORF type:complete len:168 (+),score=29.33 TRINITY_DN1904_c1_g1_i1:35-505(+)
MSSRCVTEGCTNFSGADGQCNACRRGERPDPEKRKREEEGLKQHLEDQKARKDAKKEKHRNAVQPCTQCGKSEKLSVTSRGLDNNYWTLPSGKEGAGYMPSFPALGDSDGLSIVLCVHCGMIEGFNSDRLREIIAQEEANEDNDADDDNDDDDDDN